MDHLVQKEQLQGKVAVITFVQVSSHGTFSSTTKWYKALTQLTQGEMENVITLFKDMISIQILPTSTRANPKFVGSIIEIDLPSVSTCCASGR